MEHFSNEFVLPLASLAFLVLVVMMVVLSLKSCISGTSRDRRFKYVLLNAKPEIQNLREDLFSKAGLNILDDKVHSGMNLIIIEVKHKLTNQQWRDIERVHNSRLILVHQISKTRVEISEDYKDEVKHTDIDGLKVSHVSKLEKTSSEAGRQHYKRVEIEGSWLNITLLLDSLSKGNCVEKEVDRGSCSFTVEDDQPLLQESLRPKKPRKRHQENATSHLCDRNRTEKVEIESQLYDYVVKHRKDQWQNIINPEPFNYSYKAGSLALTGQECMVSRAVEGLANLFQSVTGELSEDVFTLSKGVNVEEFQDSADLQIAVPMKTLILPQARNSFKLLGPRDKLTKVKEMLKNLDSKLAPSSVAAVQTAMNGVSINSSANKPITKRNNASDKQSQVSAKSNAGNAGNANSKDIPAVFSEKSLPVSAITVSVLKGDLTKQVTDVLVSPANESLQHGSRGAAKAIASAAGHQLVNECRRYIECNGRLPIGNVMHTTAGNLQPQIKFVIHAAGPSASRYRDEKTQRKIVQETFFNCYKYANDQLKATSIAIPAISSGILGIPKDVVAQSAFDALAKFEEDKSIRLRTLGKVCFVNIDDESTQAFQNVLRNRQSFMAPMKSLGNGEYQKESNGTISDVNVPKRKRVLKVQESSSPSADLAEYGVVKQSKPTMNFEKVDPLAAMNESEDDSNDSVELEDCVICMESITDPEVLQCGHKFCKSCIKRSFEAFQPKCPSCGRLFGLMRGNQPKGTMTVTTSPRSLSGYEKHKTIVLLYSIPSGIQDERHPNPGQQYNGTQRQAYLPDNTEGREVCKLLRKAFDAGLVFTVGRSSTTGRDNQVIWNDIHHKTSEIGPYGYPDPLYLMRVKEELKAKGISSSTPAPSGY